MISAPSSGGLHTLKAALPCNADKQKLAHIAGAPMPVSRDAHISHMQIHTLLLDLFGSIALVSAAMVIVSKNPIHSVIFLILVFCNTAGLLALLKIEFLAMMFLIIYVGAIAVLFLFVVMMLNIKAGPARATQFARYLPIGGVMGSLLVLDIIFFGIADAVDISMTATTASGLHWEPFATPPPQPPEGPPANTAALFAMTPLRAETLSAAHDLCLDPVGPMSCGNVQKRWTSLIDSVSNIQSLGLVIYTYYFYYFLMSSLILLVAMIGAIVLTMHKRRVAAKKQLVFRQVARNFEEAIGYADS